MTRYVFLSGFSFGFEDDRRGRGARDLPSTSLAWEFCPTSFPRRLAVVYSKGKERRARLAGRGDGGGGV